MLRTLNPMSHAYDLIRDELEAVKSLFDQELRSDLPCVNTLCEHVRKYHGKMLRPALSLLVGKGCGAITPQHITLGAVLELVHVATLVHDDVLDEAQMRRQQASINAMSSNETAVLLGDYLISHAYHLCSSIDSQHVARVIAGCTNTVCEGEILQVSSRGNLTLSYDDYMVVITRKTAALTGAAAMLGAHLAGASSDTTADMHSFGRDLGVAFQIVDDVLDIVGNEAIVGKTLGLDIENGKLTLPLIHYLETASEESRREMIGLLSSGRTEDSDEIKSRLSESVSFALQIAQDKVTSALDLASTLPNAEARDALVTIASLIIHRHQ